MTEIKSDVKETVKAFIQTLVSIIVKEATKKMIKSLTEREKRKFESKIKDMSDDQIAQYLDKNLFFKNALENALKSLDYTRSAKGTVSLTDKLQSIFKETSIRKPISVFSWPAPHAIPAILIGIVLLSTIPVVAEFMNNTTNNISFDNNTSFNSNITSYPDNFTTTLPVANFSSNVTSGYSPFTVQFNDSSKNATALKWNFGDGNNSTEQSPVHTYFAKGNYTVNLTAINGNGTNSTNAIITVLEKKTQRGSMGPSGPTEELTPDPVPPVSPVASFSTNVTSGAAPLSVQFTDLSESATSWSWNFGDGQTSSDQNPVNRYYSPGTYTVSLTASNANGSNISTKSNLITVDKTTHTLTWSNPADITYGTALSRTQLNAVSSVPGTFVYTPSAGTVMSAGTHTLHVDFTPADTANYTSVSKDVTINVLKATPNIDWSNPTDITYGEPIMEPGVDEEGDIVPGVLNAEFTGINGNPLPGNHTYTPATGTVMSAGTHTLHIDFTPADTANYTNATRDVQINILQAIPYIFWNNLADITYGTPLSTSQLNAVASVSGNFTYTSDRIPIDAGTVLSEGTHTLYVDFTPDDVANYSSVSKTNEITIFKTEADLTISSFSINPASPTTADQITFTAVVMNQGNSASSASTISIKVGGESQESAPRYDIPSLAPGDTYTVTRTLNLNVAQNYVANATADPDGNVDESDESNNQATVTFYVGTIVT